MWNLDDKEEGEIFNKLMVNLYSSINIMRISNYFPHEFIINPFDFSIVSIYSNLSQNPWWIIILKSEQSIV